MEAEVTQNTPPDWDFFMKQLQRVETLSKRVGFSEIRISEAQDDILAIKQEVGMQEGGKEKNVIQKKVSSILTANQKKRYENIGKQFVQGAGKQFARIKSAIKYNQQMQTNKKKFEEGAVKVKETSKKTVKTGGFWKKILGVIAILGMVGLLFRDKIAKMLPDLSGSMDGIGEKIYSFFSTVISNVVQYSTNVLGGTITGVIQYACTKILPNIITTFFNSTLPVALVAATLTVMSMFSDSAGQQAQSLLQKQAEAPSENIASDAEAQFDALRGMQQLSKKQAFDFNNLESQTYWGIVGMMTSFSEWLISTDAASKKVFEDLDAAIDENGAVDLASLENFNMTSLLLQLENAKGKTEEEKRGIIISHLSKAGVNTNGLTISKSLIDNLVSMGGRMVTNENYVKLQQAKEAAMQRESTEMIPSQTQPSVSLMNVRDINISQVISRNFISSCKEVLESLDKFLNGSSGDGNLFSGVNTFFTKLSDQAVNFMAQSMSIIASQLQQMTFIRNANGDVTFNVNSSATAGNVSIGDNSNVMILNIQIDDVLSKQVTSIENLVSTETAIHNLVEESNKSLEKAVTNLQNCKIVIGGGVNKQYVDAKCGETLQAAAKGDQDVKGFVIQSIQKLNANSSPAPEAPAAIG